MSWQSKFCMIGAPIVAFGLIALAIDDPAPVQPVEKPAITDTEVRGNETLVVSDYNKGFLKVTNVSGEDIWQADFRISYYGDDGEFYNYSKDVRLFAIANGQSKVIGFTVDTKEDPKYYRVVDENITIIGDDFYGAALRHVLAKSPDDLTLRDCYMLRGGAPERPCTALKAATESTQAEQEQRAAQEAIEDGTLEYAQEFAGK